MAVNYRGKKFYNIGPLGNVRKLFYFMSLSYPKILDYTENMVLKANVVCYIIEGSTKAYIK
jgi:hypothetical protein